MSVRVTIVEGSVGGAGGMAPLGGMVPAVRSHADSPDVGVDRRAGVGAVLVFEGIVRGLEAGELIAGLEYEVYEPMATRQMEMIARGLVEELGLVSVRVWHSRGRVGGGECSLRVVVRSAHRKEGLVAMERFIDALKRDVPIWKRVVGRG